MADDSDAPLVFQVPDTVVGRRAGGSAADTAEGLRRSAPVRTALARLLRVHTDERAWRVGATGEAMVASVLDKLNTDRWHVFHDVPVGSRGANVDHLVIGPGGVFSVNAKNLTGQVWVGERALLHNGYKTDYLWKARREANDVARRLTTAVGSPVDVRGVVAVICDEFTVKAQPPDIAVVARRRLKRWLEHQPSRLTDTDAFAVAAKAHRRSSWT